MATLQTTIDNARADMKIDPGKVIWADPQLLRYANEAISFIYAKADFKFAFKDATITPLVAGQASYTPEADFKRLLWAKLVDGNASSTASDESTLENVTDWLTKFQEENDMDATGDAPGYIYEEQGKLYLYPVPTAATAARYTVKYKYSEYPDVYAVTDTPAFPSEWHFIVEHYVRYRAFASIPGATNRQQAADALNEWDMWSKKAIADMLQRDGEYRTYLSPNLPKKRAK